MKPAESFTTAFRKLVGGLDSRDIRLPQINASMPSSLASIENFKTLLVKLLGNRVAHINTPELPFLFEVSKMNLITSHSLVPFITIT